MGLFRKKCEYCRNKIEKGKEIFRNVKNHGINSVACLVVLEHAQDLFLLSHELK